MRTAEVIGNEVSVMQIARGVLEEEFGAMASQVAASDKGGRLGHATFKLRHYRQGGWDGCAVPYCRHDRTQPDPSVHDGDSPL